jgi:integrase
MTRPGGKGTPPSYEPLTEIKRIWASVCKTAGLAERVARTDARGQPVTNDKGEPVMVWESTVRLHDLRHTHASILASLGLSLPIIGALLGHTQASTTHRYAHLMDDPLRAATERLGAIVTGTGEATGNVVQMADAKRA